MNWPIFALVAFNGDKVEFHGFTRDEARRQEWLRGSSWWRNRKHCAWELDEETCRGLVWSFNYLGWTTE